ncbi:MAG: integration host factor subunit beta [Kiloniellales bacterium]|nr:integration host factor subunit beta [Kiloniellales bacterium]
MNKSDLINLLATRAKHISLKDMEVIVNEIFSSMADSLKQGTRIEIRGFGSFEVRERKARVGRNPKSGEKVQVGPRRVPFFKVGKELRERINSNGHVVLKSAQQGR